MNRKFKSQGSLFLNSSLGTSLKARGLLLATVSSAMLMLAAANSAKALPVGAETRINDSGQTVTANGSIVNGSGNIDTTTGNMRIIQTTKNAVINWQSFNVARSETVTFELPDATGATLNRITNGAKSQIDGTIKSNGAVYFVNPNGMVFSTNANLNLVSQVNVGSLYISTEMNKWDVQFGVAPAVFAATRETAAITVSMLGRISGPEVTAINGVRTYDKIGKVEVYGPSITLSSAIDSTNNISLNASGIRNASGTVTTAGTITVGGAITTQGGNLSITSNGNIALNSKINLGAGVLSLTNNATDTSTITNAADIIADRLTVTSTSKGNVTITNVHIAKLGEVKVNAARVNKSFTLSNLADLTVDGKVDVFGSLTLTSYALTVNKAITIEGTTTITATDNIELNSDLLVYAQGYSPVINGALAITSSNGSVSSSAKILGVQSLAINAATGVNLNKIGSNGNVTIINGGTIINGDIVLNGKVGYLEIPDESDESGESKQIYNLNALSITNNAGRILINNSLFAQSGISLIANNGSIIQAAGLDEDGKDYIIKTINGGVTITSKTSNEQVGIRVTNVRAEAELQNDKDGTLVIFNIAQGKPVVSNIADGKNDLVLTADTDIVVDPTYSLASSLSTNFGRIFVTSNSGSIITNGGIELGVDHQGVRSSINLSALSGAVSVNNYLYGVIDYDTIQGDGTKKKLGADIGTVAVNISSGIDGININGGVNAVGNLTINAGTGNVVLSESGTLFADGAKRFDSDENLTYSKDTSQVMRGVITISGRDFTALEPWGNLIWAGNQFSATMSGNIKIGGGIYVNSSDQWTDGKINLSAANGSVSVGTIFGNRYADSYIVYPWVVNGVDAYIVPVTITSGTGGISLNGDVVTHGKVTINAGLNGNVTVLGRVKSTGGVRYDTLKNVVFSTVNDENVRGQILITGRNLTTGSSASLIAVYKISANMSGNINIGSSNTISVVEYKGYIVEPVGLYKNQSVSLIVGANKQITIGSYSSIAGNSITVTGGILNLSGTFNTNYEGNDGSIAVTSTSGNISFDDAKLYSAKNITITAAGNVTGTNGSKFSTGGVLSGAFTIAQTSGQYIGSVNMTNATISTQSLQIDARGAVMLDNLDNKIDKIVYIRSNGGDISVANGKNLDLSKAAGAIATAIPSVATLDTGGTVRSITLTVKQYDQNLGKVVDGDITIDGNVLLRGNVVRVNAERLIYSGTVASGSNPGLYYNNKNNSYYENNKLINLITNSTGTNSLVTVAGGRFQRPVVIPPTPAPTTPPAP